MYRYQFVGGENRSHLLLLPYPHKERRTAPQLQGERTCSALTNYIGRISMNFNEFIAGDNKDAINSNRGKPLAQYKYTRF